MSDLIERLTAYVASLEQGKGIAEGLIPAQQAEIERLTRELQIVQAAGKTFRADAERLRAALERIAQASHGLWSAEALGAIAREALK